MRFDSLLDSVGRTPLVGLPRLSPSPDVRLWAKLEDRNPTGSLKDRPALRMIETAEREGLLSAGLHDPGADIGQHRHLAGDGRCGQGLPAGVRHAGEHLGGAPAAVDDVGRGDRLLAGGGRLERGRPGRQADGRGEPRTGSCSTSTATLPTPSRTTRPPGRRSSRTCPTITHFVAGLGTTGTLMGVGRYLREKVPGIRSSRPSRATASWSTACATSTRDSSRSSTTSRCSSSRFSVGPREAVRRTRELLERGGHLRRDLHRRDRCTPRSPRRPRRSRPASAPTSRSSSATAAGSTCRPVPTRAPLDEAEDRLDGHLWA